MADNDYFCCIKPMHMKHSSKSTVIIMLAMLLLIFSLIKKKIAGIFLDGIIVLLGTITCAGRMAYMWVFPMAHTIPWLHYTEYLKEPVLPLFCSYLYFGVINAVLIILSIVMSKHYNGI